MLKTGNYRERIDSEIRGGNHASRGVFTRFDPVKNPDWDTGQRFTKAKDAGIVGKTIREAANGEDSLSFLLDLLAEDPEACVIPLSRRPELYAGSGCVCLPAGSQHRAGYLDV